MVSTSASIVGPMISAVARMPGDDHHEARGDQHHEDDPWQPVRHGSLQGVDVTRTVLHEALGTASHSCRWLI